MLHERQQGHSKTKKCTEDIKQMYCIKNEWWKLKREIGFYIGGLEINVMHAMVNPTVEIHGIVTPTVDYEKAGDTKAISWRVDYGQDVCVVNIERVSSPL